MANMRDWQTMAWGPPAFVNSHPPSLKYCLRPLSRSVSEITRLNHLLGGSLRKTFAPGFRLTKVDEGQQGPSLRRQAHPGSDGLERRWERPGRGPRSVRFQPRFASDELCVFEEPLTLRLSSPVCNEGKNLSLLPQGLNEVTDQQHLVQNRP